MATQIFKFFSKIGIAVFLLAISASNHAEGPMLEELHHTVEEAKITISIGNNKSEGTVTSHLLECSGCTPKEYDFNSATILLNQFGAQRPINELQSWSGNRAMFHYRKADNIIEQIQILP